MKVFYLGLESSKMKLRNVSRKYLKQIINNNGETIITSDEHLVNSSISSAVRNLFLANKRVWRFGRQDIEPGSKHPIALLDRFKVVKLVKHDRPSIFSSLLLWRYRLRSSRRWLIIRNAQMGINVKRQYLSIC